MSNASTKHHKVIIIGGGISGLKAAEELTDQNLTDFKILEARDRLGGRLHTDRTGIHGIGYNMGASWHHDTLQNPLFDEVVASGDEFDLYYDDYKLYYFGQNYKPKDFDDFKVEQCVAELEKYIELEYFESIDRKDESLHEIVTSYLFKQRKLLTEEQIQFVPQFIRHLELWHGVSWDNMSAKFSMVDNVGRNCLMKCGYDKLVDKIAKKLPKDSIELGKVVRHINRAGDTVDLKLEDGSSYTCDYLIVTVPQSILQLDSKLEGGIEWTPKLPSPIQNSLNNMSFGKLGKMIFEFNEAFWKHIDYDRFVAISNPESSDIIKQLQQNIQPKVQPVQESQDPKPWDFPVLILNLYKSQGVPSLLCFTQGPLTEFLEAHPESAWKYMEPIIAKLVDKEAITQPVNTIASNWTVDPFSRGSYAACLPGNDPTELVIHLARGLGNVRFAGEHTILDGAGAVHGAWMSGKREADHILIKLGLMEGELEEW
ncbi:unnamed protein product [Ambrosiozyma monospora]|uniref:Unnamed protein product n=1 Tax=Ambrosiozyma monospora TaxID=43982 RepID=A0ACB5SY13_AMBMO|nr:unnamed protein product [Ambrosiozyma monospora]